VTEVPNEVERVSPGRDEGRIPPKAEAKIYITVYILTLIAAYRSYNFQDGALYMSP